MSTKKYDVLINLINQLLARKDELPNHRQRDEDTGKIVNNQKHDAANSWYMKLIHESFPDEDFSCAALGVCIRLLIERYVTSIPQFKKVWPLLKQMGIYIAARESQYFSDISKALKAGKKSAAFKEIVTKTLVQTAGEKALDRELNPSNLDDRVKDPIYVDLANFIQKIQENKDSNDRSVLGWVLEGAVGSRSIDVTNPEIMTVETGNSSSTLKITGHSKVRSDGQWEQVKNQMPRQVKPIGMRPEEVLSAIEKYRAMIAPEIEFVQNKHKSALSKLSGLKKLHFMNEKIGKIINPGLGEAAKKLFPQEAAIAAERGQPWASHVARALNANASVELHMKPGESVDVFMRDHLQHANFGTSVSYKQVTFKKKAPAGAVAADAPAPDVPGLLQSVVDLRAKVNELEMRLNEKEGKVEKDYKEGEMDQKHNEGSKRAVEPSEDVVEPPKKKTKPNAPAHRPIGPQTTVLKDRHGGTHTLTKLERKVNLTKEQFQARVDKVEEMLLELDIAISGKNLRKMGIGVRSLCLRQGSEKNGECDPTDYEREK